MLVAILGRGGGYSTADPEVMVLDLPDSGLFFSLSSQKCVHEQVPRGFTPYKMDA